MKKILVLGAGFVANPLVKYLLKQPDTHVTVTDLIIHKAQELVKHSQRGTAKQLDVGNEEMLKKLILETDIVISLLPWIHHINVAKICLELRKNMVTTSYVKPEMKSLDTEVKEKGLLFLNEVGVDPGIDHMAAMKIIDTIKNTGGKITSFYSYCGGLPALVNNNNPLGYKFSWSPEGMMLAATNDGRYLNNGDIIEIPGDKLFEHYWLIDILPGAGTFEAYVNRDALPYIELYNIDTVESMYRGTLRNIGHCESWNGFKQLGLFNRNLQFDFQKVTPRHVLANLVNSNGDNLLNNVADFLDIKNYSIIIKKLEWLGLFSDRKLPLEKASVFDMFAHILQQKLIYQENEVDLLVQHHEFIAIYPDSKKQKTTATLICEGIPGKDSAMARTVGLPAAIATKLILENKINLKGVNIPIFPEIYKPVLEELERMGIKFQESITM